MVRWFNRMMFALKECCSDVMNTITGRMKPCVVCIFIITLMILTVLLTIYLLLYFLMLQSVGFAKSMGLVEEQMGVRFDGDPPMNKSTANDYRRQIIDLHKKHEERVKAPIQRMRKSMAKLQHSLHLAQLDTFNASKAAARELIDSGVKRFRIQTQV